MIVYFTDMTHVTAQSMNESSNNKMQIIWTRIRLHFGKWGTTDSRYFSIMT